MKISVSAIVCALLATAFADQVAAASLSGGYMIGALGTGCYASGSGSGSLTESSSGCSTYLDSGSFQVSGSGAATYDTLRATAGVGFSNVDPNASATGLGNAQGGARYDDSITIDIPGRTGQSVDLVFTAAMHGSMSASADSYSYGQANASLNVYVGNDGYVLVSRNAKSAGVPADNDYNPGRAHIIIGTPFAVSAELKVSASLQSTAANDTYSGNVLAAFGNSAGITSFELFETGGETPITNWNLSSESGAFGFYTVVPVPASGWLFMSGLIALGARLRRQRAPETLC